LYGAQEDALCIEIPTSDGTKVIEELHKNGTKRPSAPPFVGWSIDDIYNFYKQYLRQDQDSNRSGHFTAFTFIVISEICVKIGAIDAYCDAPEYEEDDDKIILKRLFAMPTELVPSLNAMEMLTMMPADVLHPNGQSISIRPPPTMMPVEDGMFVIATPNQARKNKKEVIRGMTQLDVQGPIRERGDNDEENNKEDGEEDGEENGEGDDGKDEGQTTDDRS